MITVPFGGYTLSPKFFIMAKDVKIRVDKIHNKGTTQETTSTEYTEGVHIFMSDLPPEENPVEFLDVTAATINQVMDQAMNYTLREDGSAPDLRILDNPQKAPATNDGGSV